MKMQSITRKLMTVVLLLEFISGLVLIGVVAFYENHVHLQAFDVMLRGRAYALLGSVQDADDAADSVMLDLTGMTLPKSDYFDVDEAGHSLGRSSQWPEQEVLKGLERIKPSGVFHVRVDGRSYRFIVIHGVRVVDPRAKDGGVAHSIRVIYGAPTQHVYWQVMETVRFYAIATVLLLTVTGGAMAWSLKRGLAPLKELAEEAGRISAQQWSFHPPESAHGTQELAPLTGALEAALGRLQQAFSQQRRFTSNAAHELKTDIAIAKSSLQLLNMRPRTPEEYQQGLEICLTDCLRLEETVQRMLTLARVESAGSDTRVQEPRPHVSDAVACVRESVRQLTALAELSHITINIEAPKEALVPLNANDCVILCSNLLHNALVHSKPGSVVNIVVTSSYGTSLAVQDYGDGIAPEDLPHVFEPFYRGDTSRDRRNSSTGLGLAICKALCESVGGSITLTSQPGEGTMATICLPAALMPPRSDSETHSASLNAVH